jgi:hypothetical protein
MKKLTNHWVSLPDRKNLVFEIWYGDDENSDQVAEISCEKIGTISIELMEPPNGERCWTLDFSEFQKILSSVDYGYLENQK